MDIIRKIRFEKRTEYDVTKEEKKNNYTLINKSCKLGQIVLFGDSITEFFDVSLLDGKSELEIYNRGISGDTSNKLLKRLFDNVISISPKEIILLIGTNDFDCGADSNYVFSNIKKVYETVKAELPETKLVIECIYPVNPRLYSCEKTRNENVKKVNLLLKDFAKESGVFLLDLTDALSDSDGFFRKEYTDDGLHPNDNGNKKIAEELSKILI